MPTRDPRKFTAQPIAGLAARVHRAAPALQVVSGWLQRHRSRRALALLDLHLRRDIGLTMQDVTDELRKPFWQP